ncbi:MAG: YgcG family protein [Bdellovibrionales bacterium]
MRIAAVLISVLLFCQPAAAKKFVTPWLSGPVVDEVGLLSADQRQQIEQRLHNLHQSGVAQVQVFVTKSLQELPIEQASIEITDQWKLGDKTKDNGILFLIAPNERKLRIEVGQGLEGVLPDAYAKRITDDVVIPYFRKGDMALGVLKGVEAIEGVLLNGEPLPEPRTSSKGVRLNSWFFVGLWVLMILFGRIGRRRLRGGGFASGMGGYYGGGSSGGFGRSGGSSWSGGGGGFSGGGASGSW